MAAFEGRMSGLEDAVLSSIRDLGVAVGQLITMRQSQAVAESYAEAHYPEPEAPAQPQLVFQFHTRLTDNTMYRVYQDAFDHPVTPGQLHIHTRREMGSIQFDALEVDHALEHLITDEFKRQTGGAINSAFYLEVYRSSAEPIDETSVRIEPAPAPVSAAQPTAEMPAVQQGVFNDLTPAQQMAQMVAGLTQQVQARQLGNASAGLPKPLSQ
ncbi:hypothetical protein D3C73_1200720 [compost metagenome]|jgi:hypothetical protein